MNLICKLLILLSIGMVNPLLGQKTILLKDYNGDTVDFLLRSRDGKIVLKSHNGRININQLK